MKHPYNTQRGATWLWVIALIVIIILVVFLADLGTTEAPEGDLPQADDTTQDEGTATVPASWEELSTENFVVSYPQEAATAMEGPAGDIAEIQYTGPDQEPNTEITDGYRITIQEKTFEEVDALDLEQALVAETANETIVSQATTTMVGVMSGYEYEAETELGPTNRFILLPAGPSGYLYISVFTSDETYASEVDQILSTITVS